MKRDPKLSEVLAPAFAGTDDDTLNDALLLQSHLTGKRKVWAKPDADVTIHAQTFGELYEAANGLSAVARLAQILRDHSGDAQLYEPLSGGINSALCSLAWFIEVTLSGEAERAERAGVRATA